MKCILKKVSSTKGFSLLEVLIVIGIVTALMGIAFFVYSGTGQRARDHKRISDLDTLNRYLQGAGHDVVKYLPNGIPIEGDLKELIDEAETHIGINLFRQNPKDPLADLNKSGYRYILGENNIVVYTNLEDFYSEVDLSFSQPMLGGAAGTFQGGGNYAAGWNNTDKYYQVSN